MKGKFLTVFRISQALKGAGGTRPTCSLLLVTASHSHPLCVTSCFFSLKGNDSLDMFPFPSFQQYQDFYREGQTLELIGINSILCVLPSKQIQFLQISGKHPGLFYLSGQ